MNGTYGPSSTILALKNARHAPEYEGRVRALCLQERSFMMLPDFDDSDWEARLSDALRELAKAQETFLKDYWDANGYPTRTSFNGVDETPFPTRDYTDVYHRSLNARTTDDANYYRPLVQALAPVRSVLRIHPAIGGVLKTELGPEAFRVGINNGQSYTTVESVVAGLMERQYE